VFVEGEKITQLSYPAGAFAVDKSETESSDGKEGSVYLKPLFDTPLTVFFTTDKGHHFSLSVKASETFGKTVQMRVKRQTALRFVKADVADVSVVDEAMLAMKLGDVPKDFNVLRVKSRPFYVNKDIKVTLEKQYQGAGMMGYVYRLENKASHAVKLSTSLFSHKKADILALSDDTLAPKKIAYLYGLYSNIS
jgi:conjugal transfer pilus assembly protein TraK